MYRDLNGDGVINAGSGVLDDPGDLRVIGNSNPRYRFGLNLNGNYRSFDFRAFLQGVGKRDFMPQGSHFWGTNRGIWQSHGFEEHMDHFRDENSLMVQAGIADVNLDPYFPRPLLNSDKNRQTQTRYLQDASYVRLKNLQIGYNLPPTLLARTGISNMRLFVSGENLLTFTRLVDTFDPEELGIRYFRTSGGTAEDGKSYPLSRAYSIGLQIRF
jgi:hypothetical protein